MPDKRYAAFCRWILDHDELRDRWLRLNTIKKTIPLTQQMLNGLLNDREQEYLLPYSVLINTYFLYENISDHQSIGLAYRLPEDETYAERFQLVNSFNDIISERIRDRTQIPARDALMPLRPLMQRISMFDQSLNAAQFERIAAIFTREQALPVQRADVEFALYPNLVANVETCLEVKEALRDYASFEMLQNALAGRYEGINRLLCDEDIPLDELIEVGIDTVLVVLTIGYYAAIIGEHLRPTPGYQHALDDGTLLSALRDAALHVRLLNDVGTQILRFVPEEHQALIETLSAKQTSVEYASFRDLLLETAAHDPVYTRLKKDLVFGEHNILLHAALREADVFNAITCFDENLRYVRGVYEQSRVRLHQTVAELNRQIGGAVIGQIILRFVKFHEMMYEASFEEGSEYAI